MDSRWGKRFVKWGYVALSVDSYGPRGIKSVCGAFSLRDPPDHKWDAFGALNFLASEPFVAPAQVAVIGGSGGGTMVLMDAEQNTEQGFRHQFRAAIALYPGCEVVHWPMAIATLILVGQLDTLTPAQSCEDLALGDANTPKDDNVRLLVFAGAYHAFDNTSFPKKTPFLGHWLRYDAAATKRSVVEIREFLRNHLGK